MVFKFAGCILDTNRYELLNAGQVVAIRPKALKLLLCLVENAGRVVTKQELVEELWPGRAEVVTDAMLNTLVMQARQAVGDSGDEQRLCRRGK